MGDIQWIQWKNDESNRTAIPAVRTRQGTSPAGSQWTRNPIPACGTGDGGGVTEYQYPSTCSGSQFAPPLPGLYGFNGYTKYDA